MIPVKYYRGLPDFIKIFSKYYFLFSRYMDKVPNPPVFFRYMDKAPNPPVEPQFDEDWHDKILERHEQKK